MPRRYLVIFLVFCASSASASDDPLASLKKGQPDDVSALIERLVGCNHWSGEEPFDVERRKEILSNLADLKCAQLAGDEAAARQRYAKKPGTIKALQQARDTTY